MRKISLFIFILLLIINLQMFSRYYNPDIGRFISADTVTPGEGVDLQGLNRYSYCLNNPILYVDPSGNDPIKFDNPILYEEWVINPVTDISLAEHTIRSGPIGLGLQKETDKPYSPYLMWFAGKNSNYLRFLLGNNEGNYELKSVNAKIFNFYKYKNFSISEEELTFDFKTGDVSSLTKLSLSLFDKKDVENLGFNVALYAEPTLISKENEDINFSKLKAGIDIITTQNIGPVKIKGKLGLYDIYKANKEGVLKPSAASNRFDITLSMKKASLFNLNLKNIEARVKTDVSIDPKKGKGQVDKINPIFSIGF